MSKTSVSIIIPVYNAVQFLSACVESAVGQGEIILIDDGSTDGSGELCDALAKQWDSVRVVHTQNHGLSAARNEGIRQSSSEFVLLLDADDLLSAGTVSRLADIANAENLDALHFGLRVFSNAPGDAGSALKVEHSLSNILDGKAYFNESVRTRCHVTMAQVYLVRRSLFADGWLLFLSGLLHEDIVYSTRLMTRVDKIRYADVVAYNYRVWPGGITRSAFTSKHATALLVAAEECLSIGSGCPGIAASCRWKARQVLLDLLKKDRGWMAPRMRLWVAMVKSTVSWRHWLKLPLLMAADGFRRVLSFG